MLDQLFGRLFSSQWIVFLILVILLIGLSELAWHMGTARDPKKSEVDKDSGTVICSAGSVGIVAWIQFRDRRRTARGTSRTSG